MQSVSRRVVLADRANRDSAVPKEGSDIFITAFSDASWHPTTKAFGVGIWMRSKEGLFKHGFGGQISSSSEAERQGLLFIIERLKKLDLSGRVIVIQCDNLGELNKLNKLHVKELIAKGAKHVKLKHVRSHTANQTARTSVNAWCDKRAYEERIKAEQELSQARSQIRAFLVQ